MNPKTHSLPFVILLVVPLASCVSGGKNWWRSGGGGETREESFGLDLVVEGIPLPVYEHQGRTYVEGRLGYPYSIRIHNESDRRIEAVVSVDGRDVIDGRPADLEKRGYIIGPQSTVDIAGWRTSMDAVAAFRFTGRADSYSAKMGTPGEVGRIEAAIFVEKEVPPPPHGPIVLSGQGQAPYPPPGDLRPEEKDEAKAAAPAGEASQSQRNLGTQFGETRASAVMETQFERGSSRPAVRLSLRYDDAEGLCQGGVKELCSQPRQPLQPVENRNPPDGKFSEPPPGWDHFGPWY